MPDSVVIPHTDVYPIRSRTGGADYQVWVAPPVPGHRPLPPGPYPAVFVLDGNLFFGTAVETTRLMSQLFGELPPVTVVGIAYDTTDSITQAELRARDFTPSANAGSIPPGPIPRAPSATLAPGERLGRAQHFLEILTTEVHPLVHEWYDVADRRPVLFGSSLGGLFTLYAMLKQPEAFSAYLAVSPALWWDDGLLFRTEEEVSCVRTDLAAQVFLAAGGEEEPDDIPMLASFRMISNVRAMAERLEARGFPSLDVRTFVADGETHTSVVPVALTRGLRAVLGRGTAAGPFRGRASADAEATRRPG